MALQVLENDMMGSRPRNRRYVAAATAVLLLCAACTDDAKDDIVPDPGTQQQPDASADRVPPPDAQQPDGSVLTGECKRAAGLPGPKMVEVPAPDGSTYCIDSTEVTQGQYEEFVVAKGGTMDGLVFPDTTGQPPGCEFNTRYTSGYPDDNPESCTWTFEAFDPSGRHTE